MRRGGGGVPGSNVGECIGSRKQVTCFYGHSDRRPIDAVSGDGLLFAVVSSRRNCSNFFRLVLGSHARFELDESAHHFDSVGLNHSASDEH